MKSLLSTVVISRISRAFPFASFCLQLTILPYLVEWIRDFFFFFFWFISRTSSFVHVFSFSFSFFFSKYITIHRVSQIVSWSHFAINWSHFGSTQEYPCVCGKQC